MSEQAQAWAEFRRKLDLLAEQAGMEFKRENCENCYGAGQAARDRGRYRECWECHGVGEVITLEPKEED